METKAAPSLMDLLNEYEEKHSFMRRLILPRDDNRRTQWCGGYRWFSDPNIICIEKARLVRNRRDRKLTAA
jgi:hypothetical protein